ncbi:DNA adenine methyltransferase YhdJ [Rubripirellula amarantea]|uniref:DNA adenine methyltransferase YhdJ n=1 Tax=Rubripirellula amarantea TaxID=2527999 RepID=A0A5C5WIP3_9BACT|nr:site-specific DNA-methyltransferase [Rubripirellula amarantea]TWT49692.1 DNA adenine methyltransferase YhdJ [Rubripirellula amarantea]
MISTDQDLSKWLGQVHLGDCVEAMGQLPDSSVQLVFADPPFNIGYAYDEYDDRLESQQYIEWSAQWMSEVYRVLDASGAFWLAIGDEYAAELKVEAQKIGFKTRSWVVWYYTFGVHCTAKFTRSHAHLFHFIKDEKSFTYHPSEVAVPSARQLVYGDKRANPKGRSPDDTWILRPQDCVDGFTPDEDTWYFPRVAGTFKERAGFHGCQMPEQLLGRIVRSCSNPGDTVLDPFSGSSTTLTVAKKLGRQFFGFEMSQDYAKLGNERLHSCSVGDLLEGAAEPKASAPATSSKQARRLPTAPHNERGFDNLAKGLNLDDSHFPAIIEAFAKANRGYSVDRVVADPLLNEDFQLQCDRGAVAGTTAERNRMLFRVRKSGQLKASGIETSKRTAFSWEQLDPFLYASEIAWRRLSDLYPETSLDEILCDPRMAEQFDQYASAIAPGFLQLEYRWAALKLRKERHQVQKRMENASAKDLGLRKFKPKDAISIKKFKADKIEGGPGVYAIRAKDESAYLYVGESSDLQSRLALQLADSSRQGWLPGTPAAKSLEVCTLHLPTVSDARLARQGYLVKWYKPLWNCDF